MTAEHSRVEPTEDSPHEIKLGVNFKPFEDALRFCRQKEGHTPFLVPESYDHTLVLRRPVSLYGITGVIDVISEDPTCLLALLTIGIRDVEKPLGETHFESVYYGSGRQEFTEEPCILRFSYLTQSPGAYSKLLVTYADVKVGEEYYFFAWNQNRPSVKRNLQHLEKSGSPLLVVEKNLFNYKYLNEGDITDVDSAEFEHRDFGRNSFVWLPMQLNQLKTVELTFKQFDGDSGQEQPTKPSEPEIDCIPILV